MSGDQQPQDSVSHAWLWDNQEQADFTVILASPGSMRVWREKLKPFQKQERPAKRACTEQDNVLQGVAPDQAEPSNQEHAGPEGLRIWANKLLGSFSEYFQRRITGYKDDPCTLKGLDRLPILVVEVEEELTEAARAVLRLMYDQAVPKDLSPLQLAKMIRMADMWMAPDCVRKIFLALSQLRDAWQQPEVLSAVLSWLPDSSASPQYAAWDKEWKAHVTSMFQDVHAVLTNHDQLQRFRQLPFQAVRAWAASDKLVVDSENSVAVAISWWYGGDHGSRASEDQLKELSGLLRVTHLSNAYRLAQLPNLPWFKYDKQDLEWLNISKAVGVRKGRTDLPPGWLAAPRQHLDPALLTARTTINWDIPQAQLHTSLAKQECTDLVSQPVYVAGTGMQLWLSVKEQDSNDAQRKIGLFLQPCPYSCETAAVTSARHCVPTKFVMKHSAAGMARPKALLNTEVVINNHWGLREAFTVSSPLDLHPLLSDGFLKLTATLEELQ